MNGILIVDNDVTLAMELEEFIPTIGYRVKGVASSGSEAIKLARKLKPELILMDIKMPGRLDGIQAAGIIKAELNTGIIFISGYTNEDLLYRAKLLEPLGYIHKPFSNEQIVATLKMASFQIQQNATWLNRSDEFPRIYEGFSKTEIRVAELLKSGKSTKEIAMIFGVSPSTVTWHRKNIRKKIGIAGNNENIQESLFS